MLDCRLYGAAAGSARLSRSRARYGRFRRACRAINRPRAPSTCLGELEGLIRVDCTHARLGNWLPLREHAVLPRGRLWQKRGRRRICRQCGSDSRGQYERSRGQYERSRGQCERSRGQYERSRGQYERGRGQYERRQPERGRLCWHGLRVARVQSEQGAMQTGRPAVRVWGSAASRGWLLRRVRKGRSLRLFDGSAMPATRPVHVLVAEALRAVRQVTSEGCRPSDGYGALRTAAVSCLEAPELVPARHATVDAFGWPIPLTRAQMRLLPPSTDLIAHRRLS